MSNTQNMRELAERIVSTREALSRWSLYADSMDEAAAAYFAALVKAPDVARWALHLERQNIALAERVAAQAGNLETPKE